MSVLGKIKNKCLESILKKSGGHDQAYFIEIGFPIRNADSAGVVC